MTALTAARWHPRIRCVVFAILALCCAAMGPAQQVDASNTGGPTRLDAPWRLHFGDDPAYAQPGFDDSHWTLHRIDKDWASAGHKGSAGYAWYRLRVVLPQGNEPLAIAIYPPADAVEVYIDGALAGTIGRMRREPVWTWLRDVYAIAVPAALHGHSVEIALRVWVPPVWAFSVGVGAAAHPSLLGTAGDVERIVGIAQQNHWVAKIPDWAVDMLGVAVGLFSLGLFLLQRHAREYAYAAVFFCGYAASNLYYWIGQQTEANFLFIVPLNLANAVLLCLWLLFTWRFVRAPADRLLYACLAVIWIAQIATPLSFLGVISDAGYFWAYAAMSLFLAIAVFVRLYTLARRGNRDAQLFLIPFSLWILANCFYSIFMALWASGIANMDSALTFYHGSHFDVTWRQVLNLLLNLAVGAVLVLRYARSAKQEQRLRTEMEAARHVQGQLVPVELPATQHFQFEAAYRPASEVGGDLYQVYRREDGSVMVLMGDVSGKGLKAAMLGTLLVGSAGTLAQEELTPAEMLGRLNRRLTGHTDGGFVTCLCCLIHPDGWLTLSNAGHLAPYRNGEEVPCASGLPLGLVAEADYDETGMQLNEGDTVTFLSDGVVEARNAEGELFGFSRTREVSRLSAEKIAAAAQGFGQDDDISVLTLSFSPAKVVAHA